MTPFIFQTSECIKNKRLPDYIYSIATFLWKACLIFIKTGHLHVFPIILKVRVLE